MTQPDLNLRTPAETLDLRPSAKALELREELIAFMHSDVFPAEQRYEEERGFAGPDDHDVPAVVADALAASSTRGNPVTLTADELAGVVAASW